MAKSQETFGKKEREKKRLKKRQDKLLKKEDRKSTSVKGGGFEDMIAYVDEFGQFSDTPPDPTKRVEIEVEDIVIGASVREAEEEVDPVHKGRIEFFNDSKGYGFIKDLDSGEKFFVHTSGLIDSVKEDNMVTFELEKGLKGMNAVRVKLSK